MKYLKLMYLLFFIFNVTSLSAEDKDIKLNKLFNELKVDNISLSYQVEQKIWKIWSTHTNDEKLTAMLAEGSELVNRQKFKGIANLGYRPTFNQKKILLEVHIFNFSRNLYNKHLTIEFINFIRKEKKFKNINQLKKQINLDIRKAKKLN